MQSVMLAVLYLAARLRAVVTFGQICLFHFLSNVNGTEMNPAHHCKNVKIRTYHDRSK